MDNEHQEEDAMPIEEDDINADGEIEIEENESSDNEGSDPEDLAQLQEPVENNAVHFHLPRPVRRGFRRIGNFLFGLERGREENEDLDSSDDVEQTKPESITFDQNLPTCHRYLGDMEECTGTSYLEKDSFVTLPILYIQDFVLIPWQTLPLQITRLNEVSMIRQVLQQSDKTFGVLTVKYIVDENMAYRKKYYDFGCTAKICSFRDEEEYQIESLRLVVEGRDRFQVMEKRNQLNGNVLAKVKLISDVTLPEVTNSIETCHRCKAQLIGGTPEGLILHHKFKRHNKVLRRTSMSTAWPAWVHRMYDVNFLKLAIFTELREWNQELKESQCSNEATEFSFWVITMLPIRDQTRLEMLRLESAVQRLRMILNILRKRTAITCSGCSALVANRKDVFSMSKSGTMAAYVNPGGVVHETLTLYKVKGLTYVGRSTTEHSWFPGYAWTICQCAECHQHMGWKFKATKDDLTPKLFWGLTRSSLMPSEPDAHEGGDNDIESHFHRPSL